jgi:hypothetical protein
LLKQHPMLLVEVPVEWMFDRSRRIVRNDGLGSFRGGGLADVIGIVSGIGDDKLGG